MTTRPLDRNGTYNEAAHLKFLEGARDQNPVSAAAINSSIDALTEAVRMNNGNYARALAELAYMKIVGVYSGVITGIDPQAWISEALEASEEAVRLGEQDYITHWVRGFVLCNTGFDDDKSDGFRSWEKAEELFKNKTDPSDRRSGFIMEYAEQLALEGRHAEALEYAEKALRIPDWFHWIAAFVFHHHDDKLDLALHHINEIQKPDQLLEVELLRSTILEKKIKRGDPDQEQCEKDCVDSMKRFVQAGAVLRDYEKEIAEEIDHHVEKVFLKEFDIGGYANDGESEDSQEWRRNLASAYRRSREEIGKYVDTEYMDKVLEKVKKG